MSLQKYQSHDKHELYLASVQDPISDVQRIINIYNDFYSQSPIYLREDFCGTFALSCCWVQSSKERQAFAVDIDLETLKYGKNNYFKNLSIEEQTRLQIIHDNAITQKNSANIVATFNFSYCLIHTRNELLQYFQTCYQSLFENGMIMIDILGGSDSEIPEIQETKIYNHQYIVPFTYEFERLDFNPISRMANYAIHFKYPDGKKLNNAFNYHFRMWTIPEIRDLLCEAGFSKSKVYWENDEGEYSQTEFEVNTISWNAFIVGVK